MISLSLEHRQEMMHTPNIFCNASLNLDQFLCCDQSLESSLQDDSNEWSQHRNRLRNKKYTIIMNKAERNRISVAICIIINDNFLSSQVDLELIRR